MHKLIFRINSYFTRCLDHFFYPKFSNNWDDLLFRNLILDRAIDKNISVLDIGAGAGIVKEMNFKGVFSCITGLDPDQRVLDNPNLDEGHVGLADHMPQFEEDSFDLVICDNVFEHIQNPVAVFREVSRVLKRDGLFMAKTPNKYHYMPVISSLTPTWFHKLYNRIRGRNQDDTFPTCYLLNSKKQIVEVSKNVSFHVDFIEHYDGRQEYLRIFFPLYILGILYERIISFLRLDRLKILLVISLVNKKES